MATKKDAKKKPAKRSLKITRKKKKVAKKRTKRAKLVIKAAKATRTVKKVRMQVKKALKAGLKGMPVVRLPERTYTMIDRELAKSADLANAVTAAVTTAINAMPDSVKDGSRVPRARKKSADAKPKKPRAKKTPAEKKPRKKRTSKKAKPEADA